jgi:hypothetical protein
VNPFKFFPIYNPKYARLYYQSRRLGALPPHIFAIADVTYHKLVVFVASIYQLVVRLAVYCASRRINAS